MVDLVLYLSIVLVLMFFIFQNIRLKKRFAKSVETLFQVYIDKTIIENATKSRLADLKESDLVEKESQENFISFLNQSRDWAFQYIEDVQLAINNFIEKVDPIVDYHKKFGKAVAISPWTEQLDKISEAVDELKNVMPKEKTEI
jgi:hypothetical protein